MVRHGKLVSCPGALKIQAGFILYDKQPVNDTCSTYRRNGVGQNWPLHGYYRHRADPKGIDQVSSTAATLVGAGKLLNPHRLTHIYVSPRKRATKTFEILMPPSSDVVSGKVTFTEDIAEWNYGEYEGLEELAIRQLRTTKGLDGEEWSIWIDGCEEGEYVVL